MKQDELFDKYRNGLELTELEAKEFRGFCRAFSCRHWIYDKQFGVCVPRDLFYERKGGVTQSHYIIQDMPAYKSPLDNTFVDGRVAHRDHQKKHGVVECGDASYDDFKPKPQAKMRRAGYDIKEALERHGF